MHQIEKKKTTLVMAHKSLSTRGFSLVELSIVLVILGLLVGGVLGGKSLIHAAELRAVDEEFSRWHTAVNTFRDKYIALPGDMRNATQFWGAINTGGADGNCLDPTNDVGTGTQTCNGNGDGSIYSTWEPHRFWQHLANAELITGTYTGATGPAGTSHAVLGVNAPESKYSRGGWGIQDMRTSGGNAFYFAHNYGHTFYFGAQHFVGMPVEKLLSPQDAWNIDVKYDDGKPAKGKVIAHWWDDCTNAADFNDTSAVYALDAPDSPNCSLLFLNAM